MNKKLEVLRGKIENLKRVATRTENLMVTFSVGGTPCKAFGKGAEMMTRWIQRDPNSVGEFQGYFDRRSERFGREFVAAHGRLIEAKRIDNADRSVTAASETCAPAGATSTATPSAPMEPIPAKEPIGLETDHNAEKFTTPESSVRPARRVLPVDDFVHVEGVTFEDLQNQYKSQKMQREMKEANQ